MKKLLIACLCLLSLPAAAEQAPASYIFNLSYTDAEEAIGNALADKGFGTSLGATINGRKNTPIFSYNKPVSVEIRGLQADNTSKSWSANLLVLSGETVISAMPLAGRYTQMVEAPVLKRMVRNGEIIGEQDIEIRRFALERTSNDMVTDIASLIGNTPVRGISAARPIRAQEISAPSIVKKNAMVQMRYKSGGMEITTSGQLLSDGARGDVVMVRNMTSKKTVQAVIADQSTVDVMPAGVQTTQLTGVGNYAKQ